MTHQVRDTSAQHRQSRWPSEPRSTRDEEGRSEELVADAARIALGDTVLATDAIDEVAFGNYPRKGWVRRHWFILSAGSDRLHFTFFAGDLPEEYPSRLWVALVRLLDAHVLPRLAAEMVEGIAAGETIRVGRLNLDRRGITGRAGIRRVTLPWSTIRGIERPGRGEHLVLSGPDASGRGRKLRVGTRQPNAVALPFTVGLVQHRTGNKPPPG